MANAMDYSVLVTDFTKQSYWRYVNHGRLAPMARLTSADNETGLLFPTMVSEGLERPLFIESLEN